MIAASNSKVVSGLVAVRFRGNILSSSGAENVGMKADVAGLKARSTRRAKLPAQHVIIFGGAGAA